MDFNTIIGIVLISGALAVLIVLVLWSRRMIHRIAEDGPRSAREILRDHQREANDG